MKLEIPPSLMFKIGHHLRQSGDLEAVELWRAALEQREREDIERERDMDAMPSFLVRRQAG